MRYHRLLTLFSCVCTAVLALAQQQSPSGLRAFKVLLPDVQIVQGSRIQIAYQLDATNYSVKTFDGGIESGKLEKLDSEKTELEGGVHRIRVTAVFKITGAGPLKIFPMTAIVDSTVVESESPTIDVLPNSDYGAQWRIAYDFLESKGVSSPILSYKYGMETLLAFEDDTNKCFVVVVSQKYSAFVENPILAYCIGNSMWDGKSADKDNLIYLITTVPLKWTNRSLK